MRSGVHRAKLDRTIPRPRSTLTIPKSGSARRKPRARALAALNSSTACCIPGSDDGCLQFLDPPTVRVDLHGAKRQRPSAFAILSDHLARHGADARHVAERVVRELATRSCDVDGASRATRLAEFRRVDTDQIDACARHFQRVAVDHTHGAECRFAAPFQGAERSVGHRLRCCGRHCRAGSHGERQAYKGQCCSFPAVHSLSSRRSTSWSNCVQGSIIRHGLQPPIQIEAQMAKSTRS